MTPCRILRDRLGKHCLILFEDGSKTKRNISETSPIASFALLDTSNEYEYITSNFMLHAAKDVCFVSLKNNEIEDHVLTLDNEAKTLNLTHILSLKDNLHGTESKMQIFKEGCSNDRNLVVERIMVMSENILLLSSRKTDGKQCLFLGGTVEFLATSGSKFFVRKKASKLWLEKNELFISLTPLPRDKETTPLIIAISTTKRVMIVCIEPEFPILAQRSAIVQSNLAQIGSHTVCFFEACGNGNRLSYLSSFDQKQTGIISSISWNTAQSLILAAVRPDRIVYLSTAHNIGFSRSPDVCVTSIPCPLTRPLLLLEPLVTNAFVNFRTDQERDILLRVIFEKFGPKKLSNPYQENEGIGTSGIGITSKLRSLIGPTFNELLKEIQVDAEIAFWMPQTDSSSTSNGYLIDSRCLSSLDDTKHVWYVGPYENRSELLLLDSFDEWLGKKRPSILGKVGAEIAAETGESTLLNILAAAKCVTPTDESDGNNLESKTFNKQGWINGVGEGRRDEDNLSLYIRFSEGSEDSWREKGILDLSKYGNKIHLLKPECLSIEHTTSNVDEGEPGKVHRLYDLVYKENLSNDDSCGIVIEVPRGSALDVGMFHSSLHTSRQRGTLEFWFFIPTIPSEVTLVRRSLYNTEEDRERFCCATNKSGLLWELVATPRGYLEFRTAAGVAFSSENDVGATRDNCEYDSVDTQEGKGKISLPTENGYGGWNHVSLSFSCRDLAPTECNIALRLKGSFLTSANVTFQMFDDSNDKTDIDCIIHDSLLMFGQSAVNGLRFTEIRFWACKRASEDIKMMMYEYLDTAKSKKKFKVSIRSKSNKKSQRQGLLMPPNPNPNLNNE